MSSNPCQDGQADGPVPFAGDPADAMAVARWRHGERNRLRAARMRLSVEGRAALCRALVAELEALIAGTDLTGRVVGGFWPIRGEPDLRGWFGRLRLRGAVLALPVCESPIRAMRFRRWQPEQDMERGLWGIPVPPEGAGEVVPDLMVVPLLGWDMDRYRLGFGAGYFDRTLAALSPRPYCVGVGLQSARLPTIVPQPHDVPMDLILTEAGVQAGAPPVTGGLPDRRQGA